MRTMIVVCRKSRSISEDMTLGQGATHVMRTLLRKPLVRSPTDCLCFRLDRLTARAITSCGVDKQGLSKRVSRVEEARRRTYHDDQAGSPSCSVDGILCRVGKACPAAGRRGGRAAAGTASLYVDSITCTRDAVGVGGVRVGAGGLLGCEPAAADDATRCGQDMIGRRCLRAPKGISPRTPCASSDCLRWAAGWPPQRPP